VKTAFAVMAGGAAGSLLRYLISVWIAARWGDTFLGHAARERGGLVRGIGLFAGLTTDDGYLLAPPLLRVFVMVGIFGGFTTFSSFSLQTLSLVQDGEWLAAGGGSWSQHGPLPRRRLARPHRRRLAQQPLPPLPKWNSCASTSTNPTRFKTKPLYEAIVLKARELGLAATTCRPIAGPARRSWR